MKWVMAFKQFAWPATGIQAKLMRQLYNSVAVPKLTYAAEVWYMLIRR